VARHQRLRATEIAELFDPPAEQKDLVRHFTLSKADLIAIGRSRFVTKRVPDQAPLLDQIDDPIGQVTADGAYDGTPTNQTIAQHADGIEVAIPPRSTSIPSGEPGPPTQRDRRLAMIAEQGRLAWQIATDYGQRSLVETTVGRYKSLIGPRLRARGFAGQQTEAAIGVAMLNRMLAAGRPDSVRRQPVIAQQLGIGSHLVLDRPSAPSRTRSTWSSTLSQRGRPQSSSQCHAAGRLWICASTEHDGRESTL
jgi:hypothetical protein